MVGARKVNSPNTTKQNDPANRRDELRKRVSIVINNYNYRGFIRQAIESALAQTYGNTEVIIVDDGSTDGSVEIINEYSKQTTVILKQNGGQASAFNVGISRATGDFILLLDSDDYLFPNAVEECVTKFPPGYSRVYFRLRTVDGHGNHIRHSKRSVHRFDGSAISAMAEGRRVPHVPTSGNVFDSRHLKAILPIPEDEYRICADGYLFVKTAISGNVGALMRGTWSYGCPWR